MSLPPVTPVNRLSSLGPFVYDPYLPLDFLELGQLLGKFQGRKVVVSYSERLDNSYEPQIVSGLLKSVTIAIEHAEQRFNIVTLLFKGDVEKSLKKKLAGSMKIRDESGGIDTRLIFLDSPKDYPDLTPYASGIIRRIRAVN